MPTFRLTVAYDGTGLVGWQRQATGDSVQGLIEEACADLNGAPVTVTGAGRTDAGVHALGQVASVRIARDIEARALVAALNIRLPGSIRILRAAATDESFHARFQARSKTYRYRIWNGSVLSPFDRLYAWHVPAPVLDVEAMHAAALLLEGRHDFAAFQSAGTDTPTTERVILSSRVARESPPFDADGPHVSYTVSGTGFLRHMIRTIVGSLVEVGRGSRAPEWLHDVLMSGERARAGPTAPAEGLFLARVVYEEPSDDLVESSFTAKGI
jgi:tRNA pseudouridine38-40 synthase